MADKTLLEQVNKLTLLRLLVAVIHADKKVSSEEEIHLRDMIILLNLSDDERAIIENDLKYPMKFEDLLDQIERPKNEQERLFILDKAVQAAICDNHLDQKEEQLLRKIMTSFATDK